MPTIEEIIDARAPSWSDSELRLVVAQLVKDVADLRKRVEELQHAKERDEMARQYDQF